MLIIPATLEAEMEDLWNKTSSDKSRRKKHKVKRKDWGFVQNVGYLPRKCEALSSILVPQKKKKERN
jgi:hypothetical protein